MTDGILNSAALKKITGYKREGSLKPFLEKQGIAVFDGKNGIWTTMELVNAAGLSKMSIAVNYERHNKKEWL